MLRHIFFDQIMYRHVEILCRLQTVSRFAESLRHDGVQGSIRTADRILTSYHTEFKFITGKGKGRSTISVCCILHKIRQSGNTGTQYASLLQGICLSRLHKLFHHIFKLLTQENRNNGRWCLIAAQSMIITHVGRTLTKQICMGIYCLHDTGKY